MIRAGVVPTRTGIPYSLWVHSKFSMRGQSYATKLSSTFCQAQYRLTATRTGYDLASTSTVARELTEDSVDLSEGRRSCLITTVEAGAPHR